VIVAGALIFVIAVGSLLKKSVQRFPKEARWCAVLELLPIWVIQFRAMNRDIELA
jgi:hypothetical protein